MPHRKWREIDLQPCCWLQLALPGWCLVSLLFLYGVSFTDPVYKSYYTCKLQGEKELLRACEKFAYETVWQKSLDSAREIAHLLPEFATLLHVPQQVNDLVKTRGG